MFPFSEPEVWSAGRRELQVRLLRSLRRFVVQQSLNSDGETKLSRGSGGRV